MGILKSSRSYLIAQLCPYFHTALNYEHVLMVVNTSLKSINSASEHGHMATPTRAYSSAMSFKNGINNYYGKKHYKYRYTETDSINGDQ